MISPELLTAFGFALTLIAVVWGLVSFLRNGHYGALAVSVILLIIITHLAYRVYAGNEASSTIASPGNPSCYLLDEQTAKSATVHVGDQHKDVLNRNASPPNVWVDFPDGYPEKLECYEVEFDLASADREVVISYEGYGIRNPEVSLNDNLLAYSPDMKITGTEVCQGNYIKELIFAIQETEKRFLREGKNTLRFAAVHNAPFTSPECSDRNENYDSKDIDDFQISNVNVQRLPASISAP